MGILELREHGQGEYFPAGFFRDRQGAKLVAKILEDRLKVKAERVVDFGRDTRDTERLPECITLRQADGELIIDMVEVCRRLRWTRDKGSQPPLFKELAVALGAVLAAGSPGIEVGEFHTQHGGLQGVQPAIGAEDVVVVLFLAAVAAKHEEALGPGRVVGGNQATVACTSQVLRGEEAEASEVANCADEAIVVAGADGLRGA